MSQPIDEPQEQNEIYYKGTPSFKPRKVISTVERGTSGKSQAAPAPVTSPTIAKMVSVKDVQANLATLKPKFAQVKALLDQRGASLNLCNQATDNIALSILRQKHDNETCWEFYKRMVGISRKVPPISLDTNKTFGEQLAGKNAILTDPFKNNNPIPYPFNPNNLMQGINTTPRLNNFDQDPGENTLLLMLFLAILRMIANFMYAAVFTPIKWLSNGVNDIITSLVGGTITAPVGAAAQTSSAVKNAKTGGPPTFLDDVLAAIAVALSNVIVGAAIDAGPKLAEDVTRYDALMVSNHVQELSRSSMDSHWPEAVMLFAQMSALEEQFNATDDIFAYFTKSGLASSPIDSSPLMPSDLADILGLQKKYTNDALDQMTNVLTGALVETGFCCMLKFLGGLDPRMLRVLQGLIRLEMNGLSVQFETLDSALNNLWQQIQNTILSLIMSLLYNLLGEVESRVKPFFAGLTPGSCIQWNILTESVLQYIEKLENSLLSLVMEYNNSLRLQSEYSTIYTNGLGQSQYLRLLNSLLEILANSKLAGQICSNSDVPTDTELARVFTQFSNLVGYQALSPTTVTVPTQQGQGTGTTPTQATGSAGAGTNNAFDDCLKKVSPEEVAQVQAWINQLKNMAP